MARLRLEHYFPDVRLNLIDNPLSPCKPLLFEHMTYNQHQFQFTYIILWNFKIVA